MSYEDKELNSYVQLDELILAWGGDWKNSADLLAAKKLEEASTWIRNFFKNKNRNLDEELADDKIDIDILKIVITDMVIRRLKTLSAPFGGDFEQYSESSGVSSIGFTLSSPGGGFYLKKSEKVDLGFGNVQVTILRPSKRENF